jgi:hypothetical protein
MPEITVLLAIRGVQRSIARKDFIFDSAKKARRFSQ